MRDERDDGATARLVLVLGGARSGKSGYAEALVARTGRPAVYVATARDWGDGEMARRIDEHRRRRPPSWRTVEAPDDPAAALADPALAPDAVVLVDCLTLWLTNVMIAEPAPTDEAVAARIGALAAAFAASDRQAVVVSNEVGEGIVPATALGRRFRDHQGRLNQEMARAASHVVRLVAGCPILVKPAAPPHIPL